MKQQLPVTQGREICTITTGQVPVVISVSPALDAARIVNFLRSGCPKVQLLAEYQAGGVAALNNCDTVIKALARQNEIFRTSDANDLEEQKVLIMQIWLDGK